MNETRFSVRQLADMAGVSARTLHYYDEIGLLRPQRNPDNGYRIYDRAALLRLQQILFLRELGLSLEEIQAVLDQPDFNLVQSLEAHKEALHTRKVRLERLIQTVQRTINYLKGTIDMEEKNLFDGFSEEKQREYEKQVEEKYGNKYLNISQQRWGSYPEEKKKAILAEGNQVYLDMVKAIPAGPESAQAQEGIARWHQHMRNFYDPTPEIMLGLGDGYNNDPAFREVFDRFHSELAPFMRESIRVYVEELQERGEFRVEKE